MSNLTLTPEQELKAASFIASELGFGELKKPEGAVSQEQLIKELAERTCEALRALVDQNGPKVFERGPWPRGMTSEELVKIIRDTIPEPGGKSHGVSPAAIAAVLLTQSEGDAGYSTAALELYRCESAMGGETYSFITSGDKSLTSGSGLTWYLAVKSINDGIEVDQVGYLKQLMRLAELVNDPSARVEAAKAGYARIRSGLSERDVGGEKVAIAADQDAILAGYLGNYETVLYQRGGKTYSCCQCDDESDPEAGWHEYESFQAAIDSIAEFSVESSLLRDAIKRTISEIVADASRVTPSKRVLVNREPNFYESLPEVHEGIIYDRAVVSVVGGDEGRAEIIAPFGKLSASSDNGEVGHLVEGRGVVPSINEDGFIVQRIGDAMRLVVMDGIGGSNQLADGTRERARNAHLLSAAVAEAISRDKNPFLSASPTDFVRNISSCVEAAHQSAPSSFPATVTATVVVADITGSSLSVCHAGDSRLVLLSADGRVKFATEDHTDSLTGSIYNAIGIIEGRARQLAVLKTTQLELEYGDIVVMASDGLWKLFENDDLAAICRNQTDASNIREELRSGVAGDIAHLDELGPDYADHITIVVYRHQP